MGRTIVKSEDRRHSKQAGVDILISVTAVSVGSKLLVRSYSDHVLMWQGTKCGNRCCRGGVMLLYKHWLQGVEQGEGYRAMSIAS